MPFQDSDDVYVYLAYFTAFLEDVSETHLAPSCNKHDQVCIPSRV